VKRWIFVAATLATVTSCGPRALPPLGEIVVSVDTDLPVPRLASRLRLDVYDDAGTWIDSLDVPRPSPALWPVSFGLFAPREDRSVRALVRVRAYVDGVVRDYRGERFEERLPDDADVTTVRPVPPPTDRPRLLRGGRDRTPPSEPEPSAAIDRLFAVELVPGVRGRVDVVLRGACAGVMADLAGRRSCVDDGTLAALIQRDPVDPTTPTEASLVGSFGLVPKAERPPRPASTAADGTPLHDREIAIDGGPFLFGGRDITNVGVLLGLPVSSAPERIVVISSFLIDEHEVTVGRWRAAIARGFGGEAVENDGPRTADLAVEDPTELCTFSQAPRGREEEPLNCVPWDAARAFCRFEGGDLPSEAQWEYAAAQSGREIRTSYPWGETTPDCADLVFGRAPGKVEGANDACTKNAGLPAGLQPVFAGAQDRTPSGVHGLAGNLAEFMLDRFLGYRTGCWDRATRIDPRCDHPVGPRTIRGGSWTRYGNLLLASARSPVPPVSATDAGFRCVRPGALP
jgi:formylglycine-generating enzyme required for sulfatase activity